MFDQDPQDEIQAFQCQNCDDGNVTLDELTNNYNCDNCDFCAPIINERRKAELKMLLDEVDYKNKRMIK